MANPEIKTEIYTTFCVTIGNNDIVQFRIFAKDGVDAQMSFDGIKWITASIMYHSLKAFEDRFPEAFEKLEE